MKNIITNKNLILRKLCKIIIIPLLCFALILSLGLINKSTKQQVFADDEPTVYRIYWIDGSSMVESVDALYDASDATASKMNQFEMDSSLYSFTDLYLKSELTSGNATFLGFQVYNPETGEWDNIAGTVSNPLYLDDFFDEGDFIDDYDAHQSTIYGVEYNYLNSFIFRAYYDEDVTYSLIGKLPSGNGSMFIGTTEIEEEQTFNINAGEETIFKAITNKYSQFTKFVLTKTSDLSFTEYDLEDSEFVTLNAQDGSIDLNLILTADMSVQAFFEKISYSINTVAVDLDDNELVYCSAFNNGLNSLEQGEMLGIFNAVTGDGWRLIGWRFGYSDSSGHTFFATTANVAQFTLTGAILDEYEEEGSLTIYAIFIQQYVLDVKIENQGLARVTYSTYSIDDTDWTGGYTSTTINITGQTKLTIDKGTITLLAIPEGGFELEKIMGVVFESGNTFFLDGNMTIRVIFIGTAFELVYERLDSYNEVIIGNEIGSELEFIDIDGITVDSDSLRVGTTIYIQLLGENIYSSIQGYRFNKYYLYNIISGSYDEIEIDEYLQTPTIFIDQEFVEKYVNTNTKKCLLFGSYVNLYQMNISIATGQEDSGHFVVKVNNEDITNNEDTYDVEYGDIIEIIVTAEKYCYFSNFTGIGEDEKIEGGALFTVSDDKEIIITFGKEIFDVKINLSGSYQGKLTKVTETVAVNEDIILTFTPGGTYELLEWKLNGVKIGDLSNVTITGNTISIKATSSFLDSLIIEEDEVIINSSIQTIMNTVIFYSLIIGSVSLVILVFMITILIIKRKTNLRKQKEAEEALKKAIARFNITEYLDEIKNL